MDPVTAALSQAWLQAASRIESQPTAEPPQGAPKTLVDVLERVLRHAEPDAGNVKSTHLVDRLV
jgi:hypothetical protein